MMRLARNLALLLGLNLALAGCLDRLADVGRPPALTEVGAGESASIAAERAAMAAAPPAPARAAYSDSSLWSSGRASLFGDRRAARLGDILTVIIDIDDTATLSNSTGRARSGSEQVNIAALLGLTDWLENDVVGPGNLDPLLGYGSSSASSGSGNVRRGEQISMRIAATVVEVLANGHLVVSGTQEVRVNAELRDLRVAGIIRPEDINRTNEIRYDRMAGARITYGGRGTLSDLQQPRYGQQIVDILAPF